jgi:hypothetical protein
MFLGIGYLSSINEFLASHLSTVTIIVVAANMIDYLVLGANQIFGNASEGSDRYASLDSLLFDIVNVFSSDSYNAVLLKPSTGRELLDFVSHHQLLVGVQQIHQLWVRLKTNIVLGRTQE